MKQWLTMTNVLATVAFVCAVTGSGVAAYAAATLTGANVRNGTLTGRDLKDATLTSSDFATATKTYLASLVGPKGDTGPAGPEGTRGSQGYKGIKGPDAARSYSYIQADDTNSRIIPKDGNMVNPPTPSYQWCGNTATTLPASLGFGTCTNTAPIYPHWAWDCGATIRYYCGLGMTTGSAGSGTTSLIANPIPVISFLGDENGSFVSLMGPGNIIVTGSVTLLKQSLGNHSRVACQPQVRRSDSSDDFTPMGVPTTISADEVYDIVHMTVTGGTYLPAAGDYDYQVSCWLLDRDSHHAIAYDWEFVTGNATATTTEM